MRYGLVIMALGAVIFGALSLLVDGWYSTAICILGGGVAGYVGASIDRRSEEE